MTGNYLIHIEFESGYSFVLIPRMRFEESLRDFRAFLSEAELKDSIVLGTFYLCVSCFVLFFPLQ
jgi:hypothetical protein